jgi:hypothetical protein
MKQHIYIRRLTQPDELRQLFALRYRVYRESEENKEFTPPNNLELLIDAYDAKSSHFGLFSKEDASARLIGGMRICYADGHVDSVDLNQFCTGCPELQHEVAKPTRELPFLEYAHLNPEAQSWFSGIYHTSLIEPGRFFIEATSRRNGLGLFMMRSITAIAHFHQGICFGVVSASSSIAPIYLKYGFRHITGTQELDYALLWLKTQDFTQVKRGPLMHMAKEYGHTRRICYEANTIQLLPNQLKKTA